jgi:hypothetical protein
VHPAQVVRASFGVQRLSEFLSDWRASADVASVASIQMYDRQKQVPEAWICSRLPLDLPDAGDLGMRPSAVSQLPTQLVVEAVAYFQASALLGRTLSPDAFLPG